MLDREAIWQLARSVHPFAMEARHQIHQHPELSFQEKETSAYIAGQLRAMGYEPETGIGGYGVKAVLQGGKPGPTVALRADIDALPIQEETGLPFASTNAGIMHACGHDMHTATLLAAAKALKAIQAELAGNVVFIFQPAEEVNPGGASLMIKDGVLAKPKVDAIFGVHVAPNLPFHWMEIGDGAMMASPDDIEVTIIGSGGHGAHPEITVDPVLVACQCVTLLQQIVSRNVGPLQSAVITIGMIHGGSAPNVIPDRVSFQGTVRTLDPQVRKLMPQRIEQVLKGVCDAAGATYKLVYDYGYPVLVNDAAATAIARAAAEVILPADQVAALKPTMGGEDFAYYLEQVPGSFARLGAMTPGTANPTGLHTSRLALDEECMAAGVAYFISVVQTYMAAKAR